MNALIRPKTLLKQSRHFFPLLLILLTILPSGSAAALSNADLHSIYNDSVWYKGNSGLSECGDESSSGPLVGGDNIEKALNFLTGKGLTAVQASGVIGNLRQESGLNPLSQQNGSSSRTPIPNVGFGIAQWTFPNRQQGLVQFAQRASKPPTDLGVQLDYLWYELTTNYRGTYSALKTAITVVQATDIFMNGYEGPGVPHRDNRIEYATQVLEVYGGSARPSNGSGTSVECAAVNCNTPNSSTAGLSQVRQNAVCIAKQELKLWESKPGYPTPAFSQDGYLKYSDGAREDWCADFVSWIYKQANYPFTGGLSGGWRIPSVATVQDIGQQNGRFHWHPIGSGYTPKPGDMALRGTEHINMFISSTGGTSYYIGGNQGSGPYPGGSNVSSRTGSGYYDNGITGYVSPD